MPKKQLHEQGIKPVGFQLTCKGNYVFALVVVQSLYPAYCKLNYGNLTIGGV